MNNSEVVISQMQFEDIFKVYEIGNRLFTADKSLNLYRTWDEYEIIERYISDQEYCLVAKFEGKVVGFLLGSLIEKRKNTWTYGYVIWTGVDPDFAGKGVGKKMLNKITRLFKKYGVKIILADTSMENERALDFFKKNGFFEDEGHVFLSKNISKKK